MSLIKKAYDFEVKQVGDPKNRTLEFIGSTAHVDRYGDVVTVEGWDIKNYKKNPVFLWAHNYSMPPVGKAVKVAKADNALTFQIQFAPPETYPFAETIYQLYLGGFLRATSVGFAGLEREPILDKEGRQTGVKYLKQDLYELSAVPVPANPNALMLAVEKGIISEEDVKALNLEPAYDIHAENYKKLQESMDLVIAGFEEVKAKLSEPEWIKTFVETHNALCLALKEVFSHQLVPIAPKGAGDIYRHLLNPGSEPGGGKPEVPKAMGDIVSDICKSI